MIEIKIDYPKLHSLVRKYSVLVPIIGSCYKRQVCNAIKLLGEIHKVADCDKETFETLVIELTNAREKCNKYEALLSIFENVRFVGQFSVAGHREAGLGDDPYIVVSDLKLNK